MNTEKKLEYFTQAIDREIEYKKHQARQQSLAEMDKQIAQAVAEAGADAAIQVQAQKQTIEKINNKRVSEALIESRRVLANLQERLTHQLFEQIKGDIAVYAHSPEYEDYLVKAIQAAQLESKHTYQYVQLTPEDAAAHADAIIAATGLTPEAGEAAYIGGFRLLTSTKNIAADHTFATGLTTAKQEFTRHPVLDPGSSPGQARDPTPF